MYAVLAAGRVPGGVGLVAAVVLLVVLPSDRAPARRVAINGALLAGWAPVLWWARWPVPVDHAGVLVAAGVGTLVAVVAGAADPREAARRLVPRVHRTGALVLLGAALSLSATWRLAFAGSPQRALAVLLPGLDSSAHFAMFAAIRQLGATTDALGPTPDGSGWAFAAYPQGFHALAATVSELVDPGLATGPDTVVAYTRAVALVVVLGTVVLTGAVVSLPGLGGRPLLALTALVPAWAAFLWQPGQDLLADGFANFWLAAVAAGTALVLALGTTRRLAVPDVAAVAGLLLVVAHAWAPLAVVAAPAALALFVPLRATLADRPLRSRVVVAAGLLALAALGVLKALLGLVSSVAVHTLVVAEGGITGSNPLPTFLLLLTGLWACWAAPRLVGRRGAPVVVAAAWRARWLVLAPVAGALLGAAFLAAQLRTLGTSSYYFVKLFMGLELVLAAFVPAVVVVVVAAVVPRPPAGTPGPWARPVVRAGTAVLVSVLTALAFGFPSRGPVPLFDTHRQGTASVGTPYAADRIAHGVLAAARASAGAPAFEVDYLAIGPDRAARAFYPDVWFHAVTVSLTDRTGGRLADRDVRVTDLEDAVTASRSLLDREPRVTVVVSPVYADALRERLGVPGPGERVRSW